MELTGADTDVRWRLDEADEADEGRKEGRRRWCGCVGRCAFSFAR